jgi:hypothetical protein
MTRTLWRAVAALVALAAPASGQPPSADWRTLETTHFRVHYPAPAEAWSVRAAARLDAIRERLVEDVGFRPGARTDVVVIDPIASPNGFALPWLTGPRIALYTTAPFADSEIGNYPDWGEVLGIHEDAHVVHLARPSRHPLTRVVERLWLPVGPLVRTAPRWVIEGYATVLEGDLTGAGRPHGDLRAAILRRWAQQGRLPSYGQLAGDGSVWRGMSMPYLAGSAYLEWLRERTDAGAFRRLWRRMSARERRGFDAAFTGVFGASPAELYGRFSAELTASAVAVERAVAPTRRDGDLWQRLTWTTGAPAVSPDGSQIAVVLSDRRLPPRLVVWATGPPEAEERRRQERIDRMLARDPEDVAPVGETPLPRQVRYELRTVNGAAPMFPRWMPDGRSLLFVRAEPDANGVLHPDLFRWHLDEGRIDRVTRRARLWRPDPAPDGTWAVAVRQQYGLTGLVRADLKTGLVTALTPASPDVVYDHPRVSPDGRRLAFLRLDEGVWRLVIRDLESGDETIAATPSPAFLAQPAWALDGSAVYVSLGQRGLIDLHAVPADGSGGPQPITRTDGAALAPAPSTDGRLFFLALEPHGYDIRVIALADAEAPLLPLSIDEIVPPAVPPVPPAPTIWETTRPRETRGYGVGRQEAMVFAGGAAAPGDRAWEVGVRGGDVIGRLNYLAVAALARDGRGPSGAAGAGTWRGWPVAIGAHVFRMHDEPSRRPVAAPGSTSLLDARWQGLELRGDWNRLAGSAARVDIGAGLRTGSITPTDATAFDTRAIWARGGYGARPSRGPWHWRHGASALIEGGQTDGQDWHRLGVGLEAGAGYLQRSLRGVWRRTATRGEPTRFDLVRLGGLADSVTPRSLMHGRVLAPALPVAARAGTDHEMQRLAFAASEPGLALFYERHRVWTGTGAHGPWLALAGVEFALDLGPVPLARLPALSLTAGAARVIDRDVTSRPTRAWFGVSWRP